MSVCGKTVVNQCWHIKPDVPGLGTWQRRELFEAYIVTLSQEQKRKSIQGGVHAATEGLPRVRQEGPGAHRQPGPLLYFFLLLLQSTLSNKSQQQQASMAPS